MGEHHASVDTTSALHTLLLALFTPTSFYCHSGMKRTEQYVTVQGGNSHLATSIDGSY